MTDADILAVLTQTLAFACRQPARLWELRAAMSLAWLRRQDKRMEARQVLVQVSS